MPETSTLTALAERLKQRNEEELKQIERIEKDALKSLSESLRKSIEAELNTLNSDIEKTRRIVRKELKAIVSTAKERREEAIEEIESVERSSRWKLCVAMLMIGVMMGLGASAWWLYRKAQPYQGSDGATTLWVPIWTTKGK